MKKELIILLFFSLEIQAQDVHFSQFTKSSFLLNPAIIGDFDADYSVCAQKRSQWKSIASPFNTFVIGIQYKDFLPKKSIGIQFIYDVAGDAKFSTTGANLAFSKSFSIDKKKSINLGAMAGFLQRKIDYSSLIFGEPEQLTHTAISFFDFSSGILFSNSRNSKSNDKVGIGFYHINSPDQSLISKTDEIPIKINFHASTLQKLSNIFDINPSIYYSTQNQQKELIIGTSFSYKIQDITNKYIQLQAICYNRINDALILGFGVIYNQVELIASYDINTSSLTPASEYRGGFEFAFVYKWKKKNKKITEFKTCPLYL